jgi:hypothetical protein
MFDMLLTSSVLRDQVAAGTVTFGVNHSITNHENGNKKKLDLVICRPATPDPTKKAKKPHTFTDLRDHLQIVLSAEEEAALTKLPELHETPVGAVLIALEAKATMTAHIKAKPRLYDELSSSHQIVHAASSQALSIALCMVNMAERFISPDMNKQPDPALRTIISEHKQPHWANEVVAKVRSLPRRSGAKGVGFDGVGIIVISGANDGTPWHLVNTPPAPPYGDVCHYDSMLTRMANEYDATFARI